MDFGTKYLEHNEKAKSWRRAIFDKLGAKCIRCGFSDERALQVDHKFGGGTAERKRIGSDIQYYQHVYENLNCYQILCANCNWIKRAENHEVRRPKPAR